MNSSAKIKKLARPLGAAILNLWISSLIPPGLMVAMKAGTLAAVHRAVVSACLLIPSSSRVVPPMHTAPVRRSLAPLATRLEAQEPAVDLPFRIVRVEE